VVVEEEPVEPEAPTYTMDEFLAKREASRVGSSVFDAVEMRKVTDDFSGLKTRNSDVDEAFIVLGAGKSKGNGNKAQRSSKLF
jgi:hypothetical protein